MRDSPVRAETSGTFLIRLLSEEAIGGIVLTIALVVAVGIATLAPTWYLSITEHPLHLWSVPSTEVSSVASLVTNALMIVFFSAVGLEIARERSEGALRQRSTAVTPTIAALGGMAGAALVFVATLLVLGDHQGLTGWGIPMATDVAFTLGALSLIRRRAPLELRVFLLTLAVADDVASVVVLAITGHTHRSPTAAVALAVIAGALGLLAMTLIARRRGWPWPIYVFAAIALWWCFAQLGIEPTLAGVVIGVLVPTSHEGNLPGVGLERVAAPLSTFLVLPVFALVSGGVDLGQQPWQGQAPLLTGLLLARSLGKMIGIVGGAALAVRLMGGRWPTRTSPRQLLGAALLCGIGFTVPLLFATNAFSHQPKLLAGTKVGLLAASVLCAIGGLAVLGIRRRSKGSEE